jgi:hypothetical protein
MKCAASDGGIAIANRRQQLFGGADFSCRYLANNQSMGIRRRRVDPAPPFCRVLVKMMVIKMSRDGNKLALKKK